MSSLGKRLFLKIVSKLVPDSATEVRMRVDRVDINWQSLLVAALFWPFQQSLFLPARRDPTLDTPGQMGKVTDGGPSFTSAKVSGAGKNHGHVGVWARIRYSFLGILT